jgi:RHS repeat-associated protein
MPDATGITNGTYDAASQTTQVASPEGTIDYGYDAAGEQTSMTLPGSRTVSYGYAASGDLTSLTDWQSQQLAFGYDAAGQQTSITRPNGVSTDTAYDAAGQTSTITHHDASSTLESFSYAYDDAGNRISVLTAAGTESYTFDLLNRLTEVDYANGDIVTYSYDANGNRLTQTVNGVTQTATYDDADQLTDLDGTTSSYDANGNLTAQGSDTFSWDWNNQLSSATVNGTTADYAYDGNGNRVSATAGGTTTSYLWDGSSGLPSLVNDGTNSYLSADGLQATIDSGGTTSYALDDALGSVRGLTDSSGVLTGSTDYDAFGAIRSQTGASLPLGYTGELTDPTTGFLDLRARDLDPSLGRFLSRDTVSPNAPGSQAYNPYAYVANNPTTWVDPSGQSIFEAAPGVTNKMLADAFMQIAFRVAAKLTGVVCAARSCTFGSVLLLFAVGVLGCVFDLGSACWTNTSNNATTVLHYGSTAAAGAWTLSGPATRFGWQHFPELPPSPVCALGAAEGIATNTVAGAVGRSHSSASDTLLAAATGCVFGSSGGGQPAGTNIIRKTEQETVAVIGRRFDTAVAKGWANHEVLDVPFWTPELNDEWIEGIIARGEKVYIASPETADNLWEITRREPTRFAIELEQLFQAGYRRVGDYLIPPGGTP